MSSIAEVEILYGSLQILDASVNNLTEVKLNLKYIKMVNLSDNLLKAFPVFTRADHLTELYLGCNSIVNLAAAKLPEIPNLICLDLSQNLLDFQGQ